MSDLGSILDIIRRPFKLEVKTEYQDKAVVGGLGSYVINWVEKASDGATSNQESLLQNLAELFRDYSGILPAERKSRLQEASNVIDEICRQIEETQDTRHKTQDMRRETGDVRREEGTPDLKSQVSSPKSQAPNLDFPVSDPQSEVSGLQSQVSSPKSPVSDPELSSQVEISQDTGQLAALATSVEYVKGIGPKRARMLAEEIDVRSVGDLLEYYPRDYLDRSRIKSIYQVGRSNEYETIQGVVVNQMEFTSRRSTKVLKIIVYDETGVASLMAFGKRVQYMKNSLKIDTKVVVSGKFKRDYGEVNTSDYTYELLSDEDAELIHTGRIVPVYPLTAKLNQRSLRRWTKRIVDDYASYIPEILPMDIRRRQRLLDKPTAVKNIHFPDAHERLRTARHRLAFDELFFLELGLGLKKKRWEVEELGISFPRQSDLLQKFISSLPFQLTSAQKRVFAEIEADMRSTRSMNRLLQGDVGSGKTVVAAMAMLLAIDNFYQGALMAPTEILAEQHYNTLTSLLDPMGIQVVLLRGDMRKSDKEDALLKIRTGEANIVVGTHALIQEGVEFANLGMEITDEQHRFGVMQRAELKRKGANPDVLVMTATPIPRTLALTVYGDLNVSIIDEMPPGRQKIATRWVPEGKRQDMYQFIEDQIAQGRQAYLVYPLVEESEKLEDLKAATEMAEHFQNDVFPHLKVGLIHGRMRAEEKQEIMERFKNNEINILVSTTVIEVGIDVPNASLMLIEHAERFGLAQLHQLRGRVGRSHHKSYCLLIANPTTEDAVRRMNAMTRTNDGFEIAEEDLAIRGPGEFFGTRQAGMPDLKVASLVRDAKLLEVAREEAFRIAAEDPALLKPEHQMLKRILREKWRENLEMVSIG
jgi:ATP-dependent DNA helicase RecG